MRKHPLIALVAFIALAASAIAGATTGNYGTATPVSSMTRAVARPDVRTFATDVKAADMDALTYRFPTGGRDLAVAHDPGRPHGRLSSTTGLPLVAHRHRHHVRRESSSTITSEVTNYSSSSVSEAPAQEPQASPPPAPTTTTTTSPPPVYTPSAGVWYELRMCESGDNYAENTGNGYYGAYQFALSTWESLGLTGLPSDASPAAQDAAARQLQAEVGWSPWPACSAELGL